MSDAFSFGLLEKNHQASKDRIIQFKFTINSDVSIMYNGHYHVKDTMFVNNSTGNVEGYQVSQYVSFDISKILRDYPTYTNSHIEQITVQLVEKSYRHIISNNLGTTEIVFNVVIV